MTIELNEKALDAAFVAADNCIECTCEDLTFGCFYHLDIEGKKAICIRTAIQTYLRLTSP